MPWKFYKHAVKCKFKKKFILELVGFSKMFWIFFQNDHLLFWVSILWWLFIYDMFKVSINSEFEVFHIFLDLSEGKKFILRKQIKIGHNVCLEFEVNYTSLQAIWAFD